MSSMDTTPSSTHPPTPDPPRTRNGLRAGVVAVLAVTMVAGLAANVLGAREHSSDDRLTLAAVQHLVVDADQAQIDIEAADVTEVSVRRSISWSGPAAPTPLRVVNGTLTLRGCEGPWWKRIFSLPNACAGDYRIVVPRDLDVTVRSAFGTVDLRGRFGVVDVTMDLGSVSATVAARRFTAAVEMGRVSARFTAPPRAVRAVVGLGDVTLDLPAAGYAITAPAGATVDGGLRDDTSIRTVVVQQDIGDTTIRATR